MAAAQRAGITNVGMITDPTAAAAASKGGSAQAARRRRSASPCRSTRRSPEHARGPALAAGPVQLGVSVGGHGAAARPRGWSYSLLTAGPKVDLEQSRIKASLVRQGKPRDEKLLPRKEQPPPPPKEVKAPPAPPTEAAKPPPKSVVPLRRGQARAAAAKQKGDKTAEDRRKRLFGAFDKTAKQATPEELEGAEDGDPNGDSATAEGERYYALLSAPGRAATTTSPTPSPTPSACASRPQVQVRLGPRGRGARDAPGHKPAGTICSTPRCWPR